ncbi:Scr1 family TA system antitoxin-like transcriptional regulator [Nocardia sp. NPDC049220]|uniref:Scr1 family TA system antitoxin-like transcriptional regulator n=1 Tax=Nocardia sp. NPDC049220 TaxID=3155273 RepID=UPI0033D768F8
MSHSHSRATNDGRPVAGGSVDAGEDIRYVPGHLDRRLPGVSPTTRCGRRTRKQLYAELEADAEFIGGYDPRIIPGLVRNADYAEAKLRSVIVAVERHTAEITAAPPKELRCVVALRPSRWAVGYRDRIARIDHRRAG